MKQIAFILVCCAFNLASCLITQAPTWTTNPNLDAGEVVAANQANISTYMAATTVKSFSQHYNRTTFTSPPKVVLAMIGYTQAAPGSPLTDFGFQPVITGIAQLTFTYTITVYGSMIYDLRYLYLAVLEPTPNYYMGIVTQQFSSSSNLNNSGAAQRWDTLTFANPGGWVNSAYASSDVQVLAFPIGYKLAAQSGRSYFSINATIVNESHYSVNISTIGTNKLSQLDFSILMFNRAPLQANYVAYQDIALFNVIGNTSYYFLPTITASQYMFRNCLTGAVHIEFNLISVALVGFYYEKSSANDNFFVWRTFNNRVRNCPANVSYYEPVSGMCQDTCAPYYYINTTSKLCVACHPSCYSCTQPTSILGCQNCSASDHRSLINSSCVCDAGYYDSGVSACLACNYRCLTCSSTPLCLTCNANLSRTLSNSSECLCVTGYFQNTTCISCSSVTGCLTCSYNTTDSNFTCLTCNSSLFRTLSSDNKTCICLTGYYQQASICKACPVGCLSCTFDGVNPICSSCNASLQRTMGASNLTCDCPVGSYGSANLSCISCPTNCSTCTSGTFCTSCAIGSYLHTNNSCLTCSLGCLNCDYNSTSSAQFCLNCSGALNFVLQSSSCVCASNYTLNGTTCILSTNNSTNTTNTTTSPCGNGIKQAGQQCDDGNTINTDGCSSVCIVQADHTCVDNSSLYNRSLCYYSRQIQFTPLLIYKKPGQNSVKIVLLVIAPNCNPSFLKTYLEQASSLALFDRTRRLLSQQRHLQANSWISVPTKSMIFDQNTGQLIIQFDYDASIDLTKKYIQFFPSTSTTSQDIKYFFASPSSELTLSSPHNNLSTTYYSSSDLSAVSGIRYGFLILVVLYWIFLILTLSRNRGVVGVEAMLILQFTYFILLDQKPLLESWSGLQLTGKYSFGYNPTLFSSSHSADLSALELDSSLFNTFGITLIICCLLFSFIVINSLKDYIKQRNNQQIMQINDTQENSIKLQKEGPPTNIEKIMVYVIDTFLSLLFMSVGVLFIVVLFTNSSSFTINITATGLFVTMSIISWILLIRNRKSYSFSRISFTSILINANKTSFHPLVKKVFANYYLLLFVLLIVGAIIIAVLRKSGLVVLALLAVGCVLSVVFHLNFKIYFEMLDSRRCIINSCGLLLLIVVHGVCLMLGAKLGTGFSMVIISYVVLLLILAANVLIFVLVTKKQLKREEEEQIHNKEMQQMDNQLALANISFIGKGYNSINQSRDFTKEKDFLNSLDVSSAKKCLLNDEKHVQIVTMIEEKIRELKDFKKNIQAQLQTSQPSDQPQGSEVNNLTLQNVLGDLNFTKNSNDDFDINAI